ncbi:MAG: hypothetical protein U5K27_05950 [Desulfotignum sp.]|nr:hypothetical protein [Desulfotignum sp.]
MSRPPPFLSSQRVMPVVASSSSGMIKVTRLSVGFHGGLDSAVFAGWKIFHSVLVAGQNEEVEMDFLG